MTLIGKLLLNFTLLKPSSLFHRTFIQLAPINCSYGIHYTLNLTSSLTPLTLIIQLKRNISLLSFSFVKLKTQSFIPHFLSQFNFPSSGVCLFLDVPSALYKSSQESHMFPGYASLDATSRRTSQGILPFPAVVEPQHLSIIARFSKTLLSYFQLMSSLLRAKKHLHDLVVY